MDSGLVWAQPGGPPLTTDVGQEPGRAEGTPFQPRGNSAIRSFKENTSW